MQPSSDPKAGQAIHLLANINRLGLKGFNSKTKQELIFLILNDTINVVKYQKASLWSKKKNGEIEFIGISGYPTVNQQTVYAKVWGEVISNIQNPENSQIVQISDIHSGKAEISDITQNPKFLWLHILTTDKEIIGLALERGVGTP